MRARKAGGNSIEFKLKNFSFTAKVVHPFSNKKTLGHSVGVLCATETTTQPADEMRGRANTIATSSLPSGKRTDEKCVKCKSTKAVTDHPQTPVLFCISQQPASPNTNTGVNYSFM